MTVILRTKNAPYIIIIFPFFLAKTRPLVRTLKTKDVSKLIDTSICLA